MLFFFSLIPATLAVVLGYFVLFSSAKLLPLAGAYATYAGFSVAESMRQMHSGDKR